MRETSVIIKNLFLILICIIAIFTAYLVCTPINKRTGFLKVLPISNLSLGLDLKGGSQLLIAVDTVKYQQEQMQILQDLIRTKLKREKISYSKLQINGLVVKFTLREMADDKKIKSVIKKISDELITNSNDKLNYTVSYNEKYFLMMSHKVVNQSIEIIRKRVDESGTREPSIQRQGDNNILLQVPGLDQPEHLKKLLGKVAKLTFHVVENLIPISRDEFNQYIPSNNILLKADSVLNENNYYYLLNKKIAMNGEQLIDARAIITNNQAGVQINLNNQGAKVFAELTKDNVGKMLAIVLDNKVISAANIVEPIISGSSVISGNFTTQAANELAMLLRAGALPAPLTILEERTIGPNLGADSIVAGKQATIIGIILVISFMLLVYKINGLFASIALIMNLMLIIDLLSLFQATLTLPGIAGIVLTMGMAVDANVLIFERIKEELKLGANSLVATKRGFKQAFNSIIDSNITTIIVAIILYCFGSGVIQGFAVTLIIGIICSLFSALILTKAMILSRLQ